MREKYHYDFPIGKMCIEIEQDQVTGIYLDNDVVENEQETSLHKEVFRQLTEYFEKKRKTFDLPLKVEGTEFQMKVWEALQTIPYGKTCSYADIARKIGNPKASRPVGGANHSNPIMIVIPCHRVINANGGIGGYGAGIEVKQYLLNLERER